MAKFEKRLRKSIPHIENALVIGRGFDKLSEVLEIFNTVFLISNNRPDVRSKKLVYKEDYSDLVNVVDITAVFVDLDHITNLEHINPILKKGHTVVFVQGSDPIGREFSKPLYDNGYQCIELQEHYHTWKLKQ
jgi:hypothetical protein